MIMSMRRSVSCIPSGTWHPTREHSPVHPATSRAANAPQQIDRGRAGDEPIGSFGFGAPRAMVLPAPRSGLSRVKDSSASLVRMIDWGTGASSRQAVAAYAFNLLGEVKAKEATPRAVHSGAAGIVPQRVTVRIPAVDITYRSQRKAGRREPCTASELDAGSVSCDLARSAG
jgi:hypothetical protein